jgi:phosphoglycerol transferase MdoB-like AlkP superfamily enzyme
MGNSESLVDLVKCQDKNVSSFVEWLRKFDRRTAIILVADHNLYGPLTPQFPKPRTTYELYNAFVNIPKPKNLTRQFSGFDIMPTIIEAAGGKIKGGRLGFGASLLSKQEPQTLYEQHIKDMVFKMSCPSAMYSDLL